MSSPAFCGRTGNGVRPAGLTHLSGEIAHDDEIMIIGSQAILGQFPNAPVRLLMSMDADIYPINNPEKAEKVDSAIGEGSSFHELHVYCAQGVGKKTMLRRLEQTDLQKSIRRNFQTRVRSLFKV